MASSSLPLSNLVSFFTQSKPPPPKTSLPHHLSLSSESVSSKNRDALPSLIASNDGYCHINTSFISSSPSSSSPSSDIMSVMCPSLGYANTLFFKSGYNVQVIVDENEHEEKLINRFRREVMRAGVIQECKRRRFYESKQDEKKRKTREAAKRNRRRRTPSRGAPQDAQEASKSKNEEEEDEDNWELPAGEELLG